MIKLLFIGDIVGKPGRELVKQTVPKLREEKVLDFVIANGENAAGGSGISAAMVGDLLGCGVDAVTLGDHIWDQRGFDADIGGLEKVCRPANLPSQCPGRTYLVLEKDGFRLGVFGVLGRTFMRMMSDCPFKEADRIIETLKPQTMLFLQKSMRRRLRKKWPLAGTWMGEWLRS